MQTLLRLAEKIWMNDLGATVSPTEKNYLSCTKKCASLGLINRSSTEFPINHHVDLTIILSAKCSFLRHLSYIYQHVRSYIVLNNYDITESKNSKVLITLNFFPSFSACVFQGSIHAQVAGEKSHPNNKNPE